MMTDDDNFSLSSPLSLSFLRSSSLDEPRIRRRVSRPIQRRVLLGMLDNYNNHSSRLSHLSYPPGRVVVMSDASTARFFSADTKSAAAFCGVGGVLLRTPLSYKWRDRRYLLCDINFWRFWDLVVMRSGWVVLDVRRFNLQYNLGSCGYIAVIRPFYRDDSNSLNPHTGMACRLYSIPPDELCSVDRGYGVFSDIHDLFYRHISGNVWDGRVSPCVFTRRLTARQRSFFNYQVKYLGRLIYSRCPPSDIIAFVLEMNALAVGVSTPLPPSFDINNIAHCRLLLLDQLEFYTNFSSFDDCFARLALFCDIDFL